MVFSLHVQARGKTECAAARKGMLANAVTRWELSVMAQGTFEYIGNGLGDVRSGRLTTLEEFGANYNRRFIHAKKNHATGLLAGAHASPPRSSVTAQNRQSRTSGDCAEAGAPLCMAAFTAHQ